MKEVGFECFLLDVTDAPDAILRALCQHAYIHTVVGREGKKTFLYYPSWIRRWSL